MKANTILFSGLVAVAAAMPAPVFERSEAGKMCDAGISMLKVAEGFVPTYYYDQVGQKHIGYGHNCDAYAGACDGISEPISEEKGTELMKSDLSSFEHCACALPNASGLNKNQYSALVSFGFNQGCEVLTTVWTATMLTGNFNSVCNMLPSTNTLNGMLDNRRAQEAQLCASATVEMSGC